MHTLVLLLVLVAVLAALAVRLTAGTRRGAALPGATHPAVRRSARRTTATTVLGGAAGTVAAVALLLTGSAQALVVAPAVAAGGLLVGVLAGELAVRPPRGGTRSASLAVRRARDLVPRRTAVAVLAAVVVLLGLLALTTALAAPGGSSVQGACGPRSTWRASPWPGAPSAAPLAIAVVAGLGAAAAVLRRAASRPVLGADAGLLEADASLRRRTGTSVTAAVGLLVAAPLVGVLLVVSGTAAGHPCETGSWEGLALVTGVLAPAALALLGWCLALSLAPGTLDRRPAVVA